MQHLTEITNYKNNAKLIKTEINTLRAVYDISACTNALSYHTFDLDIVWPLGGSLGGKVMRWHHPGS